MSEEEKIANEFEAEVEELTEIEENAETAEQEKKWKM